MEIQRKTFRARHILVPEIEDAEYLLEQIQAGKDFAELAKEFSECSSAAKGGDLGRFYSGDMLPEFERGLSKLALGEISQPIKTKFGFHLILRMEP